MPSEGSVPEEKARLRAAHRAARQALGDADYAARSALIRDRVAALPEVEAARTIHVYWPLVERREVDTRPLIRRWHADGRTVVLPVVASRPGAPPRLVHRRFEGEDRLVRTRWGVHEPAGPALDPAALDVVLVPACAAGRDGHRLGYGAGYYDAFLAGLDAFTVGLVFAEALLDGLPAEPHDRPLDAIVTERETWRVPR